MINAGQDLAKNIVFEYRLNINYFIDIIKQQDKENEIDIKHDSNSLIFSSRLNKINRKVILKVNSGKTDNLEYLLTKSVQENSSGFAIPKEYLILVSCILYLSLKHNFTIYTEKIPMIYLKTTYENISGNKNYIYQTIATSHIKNGDFYFSLKRISEKKFKDCKY